MPRPSNKTPRDINQLAKFIIDRASSKNVAPQSQAPAPMTEEAQRSAAAALLGRRGGLKGGKARAKALTKKQRSQIAKLAAKVRWDK